MIRLTNVMMTNNTLMNINRNMRNLSNIVRQIESGNRIQRPSDNPIMAARALLFRTNQHENLQFQRNVEQGMAWMNVTESTFHNINANLMREMRTLAVQGANGDNNIGNMQSIIGQMRAMFDQIGHEVNQTFGGNYLFSGFRTDEPPVFSENNARDFVITQHFNLEDISRQSSFQRLVVPGGLGAEEPVSHNVHVLKLAYAAINGEPVIPGFEVRSFNIDDSDAYLPPADNGEVPPLPIIHFIVETGELVMHRETASNFPREGISVTYRKTGFVSGEINPSVYFTGREIIDTSTAHIPAGATLIYNVTQYFSRAAAMDVAALADLAALTPPPEPPFSTAIAVGHLTFELEFAEYPNVPSDLAARLPQGAQIHTLDGRSFVTIPPRIFDTSRQVSVTYAVTVGDNPVNADGVHIKENLNVQGVELVRATDIDGRQIPLDRVERNISLDMHNQEIQYEFAPRSHITVNSLAKNLLTDKMFADFRRFFAFADGISVSTEAELEQHFRATGVDEADIRRHVEAQLARENAIARDALHNQFNNMLFLIDRHVDNAMREQTQLGARMVRMELMQNRLEQDEITYMQLTSDNEDTDIIRATTLRFSAEALFMASLQANSGVIQMSLANFLR